MKLLPRSEGRGEKGEEKEWTALELQQASKFSLLLVVNKETDRSVRQYQTRPGEECEFVRAIYLYTLPNHTGQLSPGTLKLWDAKA
jgi:hypothetical protein